MLDDSTSEILKQVRIRSQNQIKNFNEKGAEDNSSSRVHSQNKRSVRNLWMWVNETPLINVKMNVGVFGKTRLMEISNISAANLFQLEQLPVLNFKLI